MSRDFAFRSKPFRQNSHSEKTSHVSCGLYNANRKTGEPCVSGYRNTPYVRPLAWSRFPSFQQIRAGLFTSLCSQSILYHWHRVHTPASSIRAKQFPAKTERHSKPAPSQGNTTSQYHHVEHKKNVYNTDLNTTELGGLTKLTNST